jgi:hypothetical protein
MESLVFLDSRDLINCVEKGVPFGASRLARDMARRSASIVLTFTTVIEARPRTPDTQYAVEFYRRLETIPHVFIPHTEIGRFEFEEAVQAFNSGRLPRHILPREATWASFLSKFAPGAPLSREVLTRLDTVPLSEHVRAWLEHGEAVELSDEFRQRIAATVERHRGALGAKRAGKAELLSLVEDQLESFQLHVDDVRRFSEWLYADGSVCPGWRLLEETFQEFRCDVGAGVDKGDLPDMTHLCLVPYMKAATLDRKWREYVGRAVRKLAKANVLLSARLFSDLGELHSKWNRSD